MLLTEDHSRAKEGLCKQSEEEEEEEEEETGSWTEKGFSDLLPLN